MHTGVEPNERMQEANAQCLTLLHLLTHEAIVGPIALLRWRKYNFLTRKKVCPLNETDSSMREIQPLIDINGGVAGGQVSNDLSLYCSLGLTRG